jgi:hypothetical protein
MRGAALSGVQGILRWFEQLNFARSGLCARHNMPSLFSSKLARRARV